LPGAAQRGSRWQTGPEEDFSSEIAVTGSEVFGRERTSLSGSCLGEQGYQRCYHRCWAGVGKSTLVNHWLRRMATENYRSAELVFGWSLYRQGSNGRLRLQMNFLMRLFGWFGDPGPRLGTAWEKGERLAKLVAVVEPYWFWMAWSHSKIHPVYKKGRT